MYSFELKGLDKLDQRFEEIKQNLSEHLATGIEDCLKKTKKNIKAQAPERTGNLKRSIKGQVIKRQKDFVAGRVFVDSKLAPYAIWVNYGTGIHAPLDKSSLRAVLEKKTKSKAKKIPWFVPADKADLSIYKYPTWQAPDGRVYYIVWGAKATHFMENGLRGIKHINMNIMKEHIKKALEGENAT